MNVHFSVLHPLVSNCRSRRLKTAIRNGILHRTRSTECSNSSSIWKLPETAIDPHTPPSTCTRIRLERIPDESVLSRTSHNHFDDDVREYIIASALCVVREIYNEGLSILEVRQLREVRQSAEKHLDSSEVTAVTGRVKTSTSRSRTTSWRRPPPRITEYDSSTSCSRCCSTTSGGPPVSVESRRRRRNGLCTCSYS